MPSSVSFRVTTYRKLARGETGLTRMNSARISASELISWALSELPDDAVTLRFSKDQEKVTIVIDWAKVPEGIRNPVMPGRMTHLASPR